jgi:hypothetical protein
VKRAVRLIVVLIGAILPLTCFYWAAPTAASPAVASWLPGWGSRIECAIDHSKIASALTDFPVLVHLSQTSGITKADVSSIFSALKDDANRRKIAATAADGTTQLFVEIEKWDTSNQQAWLWVRVPSVENQADTVLYLYYDDSVPDNLAFVGDTGSAPAQNVWSADFVMVQHLEQNGNGTAGEFKDSTSHHHDGTGGEGNPAGAPRPTASIVGLGQSFNGFSDVLFPNSDDFSVTATGELTISAWVSPSVLNYQTSDDGFINFMGKGDDHAYEWSFVMYNRDGVARPQRISFYLDNTQGGLGSGSYSQYPLAVNQWVHVTAKVDSQRTYLYRDGTLAGRDPYKGPGAYVQINPKHGKAPVRIGTRNLVTWFEGRIDEVRISNVARSNAWIAASYLSESDNLMRMNPLKNEPPAFARIGEISTGPGKLVSFEVSGASQSGRPLKYTAFNLPSGATFDASTGAFSWTPAPAQSGILYDIRFEVSDGVLSASQNVTITVNVAPAQPATSAGGQAAPPPYNGVRSATGWPTTLSILLGAGLVVVAVTLIIIFRKRLRPNGRSDCSETKNSEVRNWK